MHICAMVHIDGTARERACFDIEEVQLKTKISAPSPLLPVAIETVSSHAFELLHNGQEVLAAFLDVALLFFQLLLLVEHFLLHKNDGRHHVIVVLPCCNAWLRLNWTAVMQMYVSPQR